MQQSCTQLLSHNSLNKSAGISFVALTCIDAILVNLSSYRVRGSCLAKQLREALTRIPLLLPEFLSHQLVFTYWR